MEPKYRIKELIESEYFSRQERKEVREKIREACNNIAAQTLSGWELIMIDDKEMIPADHLLKISQVLKRKNVEELFNKKLLVTV
jgi:hypothetical protein